MKSTGRRLALGAILLAGVAALAAVIYGLRAAEGGATSAADVATRAPARAAESEPSAADDATRAAPRPTTAAALPRSASASAAEPSPSRRSARLPSLPETTPASTAAVGSEGPPFALPPTRRCLQTTGAQVSLIRTTDSRLRALGDIAQRTSISVVLDGRTLGLAFGDARLLESLMRVPEDPYLLEVRRNVLLMFRPSARPQAEVIRGCLRS